MSVCLCYNHGIPDSHENSSPNSDLLLVPLAHAFRVRFLFGKTIFQVLFFSTPFLLLSCCSLNFIMLCVFFFERLGKREHVCESPGQLPCAGGQQDEGQRPNDFSTRQVCGSHYGPGFWGWGLDLQDACQHLVRKQVFNDFLSNPWHSYGPPKKVIFVSQQKSSHLPHIFRDSQSLKKYLRLSF